MTAKTEPSNNGDPEDATAAMIVKGAGGNGVNLRIY